MTCPRLGIHAWPRVCVCVCACVLRVSTGCGLWGACSARLTSTSATRRSSLSAVQTTYSSSAASSREHRQGPFITTPPRGWQSIVMSVSVCLSVCPRAYLRNYMSDLQCTLPMAVARTPSGGVIYFYLMDDVMFAHMWRNGLYGPPRVETAMHHCIFTQLPSVSVLLSETYNPRDRDPNVGIETSRVWRLQQLWSV